MSSDSRISPRLPSTVRFLLLFLLAGIASILFHEWGQCLFYWAQGIPAAFSLTKEFPLQNITERQYAIGAAGGPLASIILFVGSYLLIRRGKYAGGMLAVLDTVFLANSCYLFLRAFLALLKRSGGELEDAARLAGFGYEFVVVLFLAAAALGLILWMRARAVPFRIGKIGTYLVLFLIFSALVVGLSELDRAWLWPKFPPVHIEGRGWYHPPPTSPGSPPR